jgi:predicted PurR-regulated permease PerM
MNKPTRISYGVVAALLLLVGVLHLSTLFVTVLFSYFLLNRLQFGRPKAPAIALFLVLVALLGVGSVYFAHQAVVSLPKIAATTIPSVLRFARDNNIELPFSDYDSLKKVAIDAITDQVAGIGRYARAITLQAMQLVIGLAVAISLFVDDRFQLETEKPAIKDNIYALVWAELGLRFRTFYESFARVMGAQLIISLINTALTAGFLLWNDFPFGYFIVALTFLCGLLPIIGNLLSNTIIVGVAFTLSPRMALWSLVYLVALHKLEYFLNSKIVGDRIKNPIWLTLFGLILGEALMGVPGMILAPVVLYYIKVEASRQTFSPASAPT